MRVSAARLCAFNAGIQLVWGAILAVELQARIIKLSGDPARAISTYAIVAAIGAAIATFVQLFAGALSDFGRVKSGNRQLFYFLGAVSSIPAIVWLLLAPNIAGVGLAFAMLAVTMNVASGPYQAVIPDYVETGRRGIASSWMSAYQSVGNAAGLLIAATVNDLRFVAAALVIPFFATYGVSAGYARKLPPIAATVAVSARATWALAALLLSRGLINVGFFTLLGFLAFYVRDSLHAKNVTQTGYIFLSFTLAGIAGAAATARATDRYDKRLVISVSVGVIAVALGVLACATSFPIASTGAIVAGFAWGAFATADWALATTTLPQSTMATAMGIWNVATTVPQILAPLATAPLIIALNARTPGLGPRAAIALALAEFVLGGIAIWLVPAAPGSGASRVEQLDDAVGNGGRGIGMA